MKRKGHRTIPDFSNKKQASPHPQLPQARDAAPPPPPVKTVKPPATSQKSGRRGA